MTSRTSWSASTHHGVAVPAGLQKAPWGRYIQFADPDGNGLILQETAPGSGRFTER